MSIDSSSSQRWGMGPMVDSDFEARVCRIAAAPEELTAGDASASGYLEFNGGNPLESLHALLLEIYEPCGTHGQPPQQRTLVKTIRYLTTDPKCGLALPMDSFMPGRDPKTANESHATPLEAAMTLLNEATKGCLQTAQRIGLTVVFDLEVVARELRLRSIGHGLGPELRWTDDDLRRVLFGDRPGMRRFITPKVGLAGSFNPQLAHAQRLLHTPPAAKPLDYGFSQTGRNTIVGIVDFGCDFAHPSFRTGTSAPATGSRILEMWDQNENSTVPGTPPVVNVNGVPCGFGYGRHFKRLDIQTALVQWQSAVNLDPNGPYDLLGYDPHEKHYTSTAPGGAGEPLGAHGTFVMEVAAGGRRSVPAAADPSAQPCGVAPDADIVFVQVRLHSLSDGRRILDMADVVNAVAFIFHVAENNGAPCVVNLSLNTMSGPHDGDGYFDLNLATLLRSGSAGPEARGRAVVIAAGNLPDSSVQTLRWQHLTDEVPAGAPVTFHWRMSPQDLTRNIVEIWYDATDGWLDVSLESPGKQQFGPVKPGKVLSLETNGQWRGSVIGSRLMPQLDAYGTAQAAPIQVANPAPGDLAQSTAAGNPDPLVPGRHVIRLELQDVSSTPIQWKVTLRVVTPDGRSPPSGQPVGFHAWLERDDNGPSGLTWGGQPPQQIDPKDRSCTIGTLSCGPDAIIVGAYSTAIGHLGPWGLSGHGPSRRGDIFKPDLSAPGHYISLVRSRRGNGQSATLASVTGTSVAAPFVTGTIACVYERAPDASLADVRNALVQTAVPLPGQLSGWSPDLGHGCLNPAGVLASFP